MSFKKSEVDENIFCSLPFNSVSIAPFGAIRVCCNNYKLPKKPTGEFYDFNDPNFDLLSSLNNDFHKELRREFMAGIKPASCHRCWDIEKEGGKSYRQAWLDRYGHSTDRYLQNTQPDGSIDSVQADYVEITLGNKCNLRCRMCNASSSVLWIKEAQQLGLMTDSQLNDLKKYTWFEKPKFLEALTLLLKHTDRLNILGGEPLIIEEQFEILRQAIAMGVAAEMEVQYNTNLTKLNPELFKLWSQFKKVFLNVSVDGIEQVNEYIRYPGKWNHFEENLKTLSEWSKELPLDVSLHCTIQALNVTTLPKLYNYVWNLPYGFRRIPFVIWVNYPEYHDPRVLPKEVRKQAYEGLNEFVKKVENEAMSDVDRNWLLMMQSHHENILNDWPEEKQNAQFSRFTDITKSVDQLRSQSVVNIFPELQKFL